MAYLVQSSRLWLTHSCRLINLLILAILATVCAIADTSLEKEYYPLGAPWLYGDDQSDDNPRINGLITWAFAILTYVTSHMCMLELAYH